MKRSHLKRRVGLLGGSFNPAHGGHLYISNYALDVLALDEVWWLVSPQNPLKSTQGMASFDNRMAGAQEVASASPNVHVSDDEMRFGTRFTVDTLAALKIEYPQVSFVWLIGADNLVQMPKWKHWKAIFHMLPIAVFPRVGYSSRGLYGQAARHFRAAQIPIFCAKHLADQSAPAWVFLNAPLHAQSSTQIRARNRV